MTGPPGLSPGQVDAYLERIGIDVPPAATERWLQRLHVAHLRHVPFENIDLHSGVPIRFDVPGLFEKLVQRDRGGYCYELNGLFSSLLTTVGFDVTLVSSRVWMPDGDLSAPFDHLALIIDLQDTRWLADVGYGDAFQTPQPLGSQWTEIDRRLRTHQTDRGWQLDRDHGEGWMPMYHLDLTSRSLADFLPRSRWHETAPDSPFQRSLFISRATTRGRLTITEDRLIITDDGQRNDRKLADANERHRLLAEHFSPSIAERFETALSARREPPDFPASAAMDTPSIGSPTVSDR